MQESDLNLTVVYKKQPYSVSSAPDETIHQLKEKLEALTMLPVSNQKLMLKGLIKDDNVTLKEAGINEHSKLLLIGSTSGEIAKVQATDPESKLPFERRKPNGPKVEAYRTNKTSPYGFGRIEVLENFPNSERARALLERLASDRGIVGLMEKYRWKVGVLKELSPAVVDKLGYNQNKGQLIALRLRFEDGFRAYSSIRDVLYHELAHNVWSEHDDNFHRFNRQLQRESAQLDWTQGEGRAVGGAPVYRPPEIDTVSSSSGYSGDCDVVGDGDGLGGGGEGQVLGGGLGNLHREVKPSLLAYEAAIMRLTAQEREITDACGSTGAGEKNNDEGNVQKEKEKEKGKVIGKEGKEKEKKTEGGEKSVDRATIEKRKREADTKQQQPKAQDKPKVAQDLTTNGTPGSEATKKPKVPVAKPQPSSSTTASTSPSATVPPTGASEWACPACTFLNAPSNKTCEVCRTPAPTPATSSTTTTTPATATTVPVASDTTIPVAQQTTSTATLPAEAEVITSTAKNGGKEELAKGETWICVACTFLNKHATHNCAMCDTPR